MSEQELNVIEELKNLSREGERTSAQKRLSAFLHTLSADDNPVVAHVQADKLVQNYIIPHCRKVASRDGTRSVGIPVGGDWYYLDRDMESKFVTNVLKIARLMLEIEGLSVAVHSPYAGISRIQVSWR